MYVTDAIGTITDNLGNSVTIDSPGTATLYTLETFGNTVSLNFFSATSITIAGANDQIMAVEVFDIPGIDALSFNGDLREEIDLLINPSTITSVVFNNALASLDSLSFKYVNTTFTTLDVSKIPNIIDLSFGYDPNSSEEIGTYEISEITNLSSLGLLEGIIFRNCKFTELDLTQLSMLESITCIGNSLLQDLNVSGLSSLTNLTCSENQLTSLDVTGLTVLKFLFCTATQINQLNADAIVSSLDVNGQSNGTFEIANTPTIINPNTGSWLNLSNKGWTISV